jgi:hypothetical protein
MIAKGSNIPLDEARAERRSGGKDLERQPRTARIQTCQRYENVQFDTIADLPSFNKDPHSSKALPAGRQAGNPTASPLGFRLPFSLLRGRDTISFACYH